MPTPPKNPAPETWDDDDDDDEQEVARPKTPPRPRMPPSPPIETEPARSSEGRQEPTAGRQVAPLVAAMPPLQTQIEDVGTSSVEKKFAGPTARIIQFRKANGLSNKQATPQYQAQAQPVQAASARTPEQQYRAQAQPVQAAAARTPEQQYQAAAQATQAAMPREQPKSKPQQPQQTAQQPQHHPRPQDHHPIADGEFLADPLPGESQQIFVRPVSHRISPLKMLGIAVAFFGAAYALSQFMSDEEEDEEEDEQEEEEVPEMEVPPSGLEDDENVIEGEIVAA